MHMLWVKTVSGRLKSDYRYSSALSYNSFPIQFETNKDVKSLELYAIKIIECRENHPSMSLAELYDPDKMPADLLAAHKANDLAVEKCYRDESFKNDEERLEHLFALYEKMIAEEKSST
jgi:hypothetical protein